MVFFYEILFVAASVGAILIGEVWSRTAAALFLLAWCGLVSLAYASFGARLAAPAGLTDEDLRWYQDARAGLRHLLMLFGIATILAVIWRLVGG